MRIFVRRSSTTTRCRPMNAVRGHVLIGTCQAWRSSPLTDEPLMFIDTAGASYDEEEEPDG